MTTSETDLFNAPELYLLAKAFDSEIILGLPEKRIFQLQGKSPFKQAYNRLIDKSLFTEQGKLTDDGFIVIKTLEQYCKSNRYVRINNAIFAFKGDAKDELIILFEPSDEKEHYKLLVFSKNIVLKWLDESSPLFSRKPRNGEEGFLKRVLLHREKHELDDFEPGHALDIEVFESDKDPAKHFINRQQWLIFEKSDQLFAVDTENLKYYHASQYWFIKMLFDEMELPYQEVDYVRTNID